MEPTYEEELNLVAIVKSGGAGSLRQFYEQYRSEFVSWATKTFDCTHDEAIDTYQDSIIILYENIVSDKLVRIESKLKTYLFAVGKNLILKNMTRQKRTDTNVEAIKEIWGYSEQQEHNEEAVNKIAEHFKAMGEPCRSLLYLYYYKNLSMKEIARDLGYKNDDVVKSQKVRCLKTLKEKFSKHTVL
jgi:RNA polymerase sigma factor (sigma-70 family)